MNDQSGQQLLRTPIDAAVHAGVLALSILICLPALRLLVVTWQGNQFYGHAFAIPLVTAYLVFQNRRAIAAAFERAEPPALGAPLVLLAASAEVLAIIGDMGFVAGVGIPAVVATSAYAVGGRRLLRQLALPLVFLTLMVPPPKFLTQEILFRLKLVVTETAVSLLQSLGATVVAEGNQIQTPSGTLFVADACSGLTSLITIMPLAFVVAHFLGHGIWRRIVIVASLLPIAFLANVLRIAVTVQLVSVWGIEVARGALHQNFGLATSVLGTIALVGVARLLR